MGLRIKRRNWSCNNRGRPTEGDKATLARKNVLEAPAKLSGHPRAPPCLAILCSFKCMHGNPMQCECGFWPWGGGGEGVRLARELLFGLRKVRIRPESTGFGCRLVTESETF
ncbi:UNVERIFIED_CONTAM: hypothetical protein K2H54_036225 [Gekko kuhli]